jgi:acetolactate synthase-1/2/3 large subunit
VNGADRICATLSQLGAAVVFGLPGTQNIVLYDALRRSGLRAVAASDEGAAAFMASGFARATGRVGVVTTIPGPGFIYALAGIAEAREDSVPLLWITLRQATDGQAYPLQHVDQAAMAAPVVKRCYFVEQAEHLDERLLEAHRCAVSGEPGPVLLEVAAPLLLQEAPAALRSDPPLASWPLPADLSDRLQRARRPLIFAGQGAQSAAALIRDVAERWGVPVVFTCSGRGVLADAHPNAMVCDFSFGVPAALEHLLQQADLVLALGCKFTHNGSAGGRLRLDPARLIRVDTSGAVLQANYAASLAIQARVEDVVAAIAPVVPAAAWSVADLADLQRRFADERQRPIEHEPPTVPPGIGPVREVFSSIGRALSGDVVYTADAGLHQALTRRHAVVVSSRGLLCPTDFQSMGFGLPAAIGAALARPDAAVVACLGDGALALSLGDLLTAVRERVNVVILLFNDGAYGLIRRQQLAHFGHPEATDLLAVDYAGLAAAVGCSYFAVTAPLDDVMRQVAATPGVRLVELRLGEAASMGPLAVRSALREQFVRAAPRGLLRLIRRALKR